MSISEFFELHKEDMMYSIIIVCSVIMLWIITVKFFRWLIRSERKKLSIDQAKPINLIRKILNTLWIVIGIISLAYLFIEDDKNSVIINNFKRIIYIGIVLALTVISATSINLWFKLHIRKKIREKGDPTNYKFLRYVVVVGIYIIGLLFALIAFPSFKGVTQTALGGAGVIALVVGIASQEALANLIGGVFIIAFKPFKIGQLIHVTDSMIGTVEDITLRHTVIRNFENKMIVIPNSIINKEKLINFDLGELKCCERIEIGISYDSDIDLAKKIMKEECENHPLILDNRTRKEKKDGFPIVKTALISLNDSSMTIRVWAWGRHFEDSFQLRCDVLESVKKRFDKEGIEIPFPYRTVVFKDKKPGKLENDIEGNE